MFEWLKLKKKDTNDETPHVLDEDELRSIEELLKNELDIESMSEFCGGNGPAKYITYIVQRCDNLTKIAKKYNTTWKSIYALNRDRIKNPNHIEPGWELRIPISYK